MPSVGNLSVEMQANSAAFTAELRRAADGVEQLRTSVEGGMGRIAEAARSAGSAIQVFAGTLAAGLIQQAAGAIQDFIASSRGMVEAAGAIGETAEQIGLTARQFQGLQAIAAETGVRTGQIETAFQRFNDALGDAERGGKRTIDVLNTLGVRMLDGQGQARASFDVFLDVADAMTRVDSATQRASLAQDLFGRSGQALLPVLTQGRDAIERMLAEAQRAGLILDDGLIRRADDLADRWGRASLAMTRFGQALATGIWENIQRTIDHVLRLAGALQNLGAQLHNLLRFGQASRPAAGEAEARRLGEIDRQLADERRIMDEARDAVLGQRDPTRASAMSREFGNTRRRIEALELERAGLAQRLAAADQAAQSFGNPENVPTLGVLPGPPGVSNPTASGGRGRGRRGRDENDALDQFNRRAEEQIRLLGERAAKLESEEQITRLRVRTDREAREAIADINAERERASLAQERQTRLDQIGIDVRRAERQGLDELAQALRAHADQVGESFDRIAAAAAGRDRAIRDSIETQDRMRDVTSSFKDAASASNDFLKSIVTGSGSAMDALKKLGTRILEIANQFLVVRPIERGFEALGKSWFGGGSGGSGGGGFNIGSIFSGIGDFVSNLFGFAQGGVMTSRGPLPLRRYAMGGIATSPQLAEFGEGAGAEAFVPLPDGRSIPVTMRGGAAQVSIQIDARGADPGAATRLMAAISRLENRIPAIVAATADVDPSFARKTGRLRG